MVALWRRALPLGLRPDICLGLSERDADQTTIREELNYQYQNLTDQGAAFPSPTLRLTYPEAADRDVGHRQDGTVSPLSKHRSSRSDRPTATTQGSASSSSSHLALSKLI
jgi:hypothetical protein